VSTAVKIVPDADPNAPGRWIIVPVNLGPGSWRGHEAVVARYVPEGYHVVQIGEAIGG
jgi:hypothetical protein